MQKGRQADDRTVLRISGADHEKFLGDLVSNDLAGLDRGLVYAAILTPQGKYLFDFFLLRGDDAILLDVKADRATALAQRLTLYRLRADVEIADAGVSVAQGLGVRPDGPGVFADPRHAELGWRLYGAPLPDDVEPLSAEDWDALRVARVVPETGIELLPEDTYILEAGFERLNGVDFRKGCYVGQEVTARMKHKTELRKGLTQVAVEGTAPPPGTPIMRDGKTVGTLYTVSDGAGLSHLRYDRAGAGMTAGEATVTWKG